jgi:hypothetical protein
MDAWANLTAQTVFQGFWYGRPLSPLLIACLRSFTMRGHAFHLYVYEEMNVPEGVIQKPAAAILPLSDLFSFRNPETNDPDYGPFSDLFRFKLLLMMGGWYIDVDSVCLSESIPSFDRAWTRECPEHQPGAVGAGQIALRKGDPIARELFERCLALSRTKFARREDLGPRLISAVIRDLGMPLDMSGAPDQFYPLKWIEMFKLWLPEFCDEVIEKVQGAYFMPIYQSFPIYLGLNMEKLPPEGSFLDRICRQFAPESTHEERHDADDIRLRTKSFLKRKGEWAIDELIAVCGPGILERIGLKH